MLYLQQVEYPSTSVIEIDYVNFDVKFFISGPKNKKKSKIESKGGKQRQSTHTNGLEKVFTRSI